MTDTVTYEDASRCPKCDNPGVEKMKRPGPAKSVVHILTCMNSVCLWFETDWVVQQLEDGTVPVRKSTAEEPRRPKTFPALPSWAKRAYERSVEEANDENLPPEGPS